MRHVEARAGLYRDSVRLMEISSSLARRPGVSSALVAMATGLNLELLAGMGFEVPAGAAANDMLVALVTVDEEAMTTALHHLEAELAGTGTTTGRHSTGTPTPPAPRTTFTAAKLASRASGPAAKLASRAAHAAAKLAGEVPAIALVSTPGQYAFVEAMDALDAGISVMIFSDNVPVEQEIRLKRVAIDRSLIVMGPDCGTAVVGGVGLGFANVVRPGPVGLVAASGTGAQQIMSLLSLTRLTGISHCLGVGGRDLSAAVGGLSTHAALDLLDADPATELIVLVSKPAAPEVAEAVRAHADSLVTPVLVAPLGAGQPDLTAVAEQVLARLGVPPPPWPSWEPVRRNGSATGMVRGLFSGGTLCVEAMALASQALGPVFSNVPLRPEWTLTPEPAPGHRMVDLGSDEYTVGRPHPMIDFGPRLSLIEEAAADPQCRVILLDVVLGHGAHPDPAAELAPALRAALAERATGHRGAPQGSGLDVVVSLVGSPDDPQNLHHQALSLRDCGAWVFASNAAAARHALALAQGRESP